MRVLDRYVRWLVRHAWLVLALVVVATGPRRVRHPPAAHRVQRRGEPPHGAPLRAHRSDDPQGVRRAAHPAGRDRAPDRRRLAARRPRRGARLHHGGAPPARRHGAERGQPRGTQRAPRRGHRRLDAGRLPDARGAADARGHRATARPGGRRPAAPRHARHTGPAGGAGGARLLGRAAGRRCRATRPRPHRHLRRSRRRLLRRGRAHGGARQPRAVRPHGTPYPLRLPGDLPHAAGVVPQRAGHAHPDADRGPEHGLGARAHGAHGHRDRFLERGRAHPADRGRGRPLGADAQALRRGGGAHRRQQGRGDRVDRQDGTGHDRRRADGRARLRLAGALRRPRHRQPGPVVRLRHRQRRAARDDLHPRAAHRAAGPAARADGGRLDGARARVAPARRAAAARPRGPDRHGDRARALRRRRAAHPHLRTDARVHAARQPGAPRTSKRSSSTFPGR